MKTKAFDPEESTSYMTLDLEFEDGVHSVPGDLYGVESSRDEVAKRLRSRGVRPGGICYKTFWRWRDQLGWLKPPFTEEQIDYLVFFGRCVTNECDGGLGLSLKHAHQLVYEKVHGDPNG